MQGTMKIAEVTSRFENEGKFVKLLRQLGCDSVKIDNSNKVFSMHEYVKVSKAAPKEHLEAPAFKLCKYKKR